MKIQILTLKNGCTNYIRKALAQTSPISSMRDIIRIENNHRYQIKPRFLHLCTLEESWK